MYNTGIRVRRHKAFQAENRALDSLRDIQEEVCANMM